jgi:hypothetical protein
MDENELPKQILWTNSEVAEVVVDRNEDGLMGWRKTQGNWVVEICGRMPRIEDTSDICLRRPRPTQGCRVDDEDNDDDDVYLYTITITQ